MVQGNGKSNIVSINIENFNTTELFWNISWKHRTLQPFSNIGCMVMKKES